MTIKACEVTHVPETVGPQESLFISELHYSNVGVDVDEEIEVTGIAGLDLSGEMWKPS